VSSQKIFLFDFDGVIVDGMQEYWHSSLLACERYLNSTYISVDQKLYKRVPNSFIEIRPWVKYGWEMILIVHEIIKTENPLKNNNKDIRPDYPFIRSILIKLEECLVLKKNTLLDLAVKERKILKKEGKKFVFRKFDLINTWQGSLLYFFILVLTIFLLKRYFILNVNVIEIKSIENQIIDK